MQNTLDVYELRTLKNALRTARTAALDSMRSWKALAATCDISCTSSCRNHADECEKEAADIQALLACVESAHFVSLSK